MVEWIGAESTSVLVDLFLAAIIPVLDRRSN